jgi:uncharacterized 2Fe-2S/4Fe-4S cluster protein (DUF4445 family)
MGSQGSLRIKIKKGDGTFLDLAAQAGANLLDVLRTNNFAVPADCAGQGVCGKCLVRAAGELARACQVQAVPGLDVELLAPEAEFAIRTEYRARGDGYAQADKSTGYALSPLSAQNPPARSSLSPPSSFCLAADIGTTTVVVQLAGIPGRAGTQNLTPRILGTRSFMNGQRIFGADVLSRIRHAQGGGLGQMSAIIRASLAEAAISLCAEANLPLRDLSMFSVAGNTAMIHILLGADCSPLGSHPYTTSLLLKDSYTFAEIFGPEYGEGPPLRILPWISAYVGGDITAGYLACRSSPAETALLLDLGTNGETLLWSGDKTWCCSAPSGPAFEGCGLTCGVGGIAGAISRVDLLEGNFICRTIKGAAPAGICGSGVLDLLACLRRGAYMDAGGRLEKSFFDKGLRLARSADGGDIIFTQGDVREVQLAKSAVRAGLEILLQESGLSAQKIETLYLAGGFGQELRLESAAAIGLLPPDLIPKAIPVGNSSLGGAIRVCSDPGLLREAAALREKTREILPASHPDFQNLFIRHLGFGGEG